MRRSAVQVTVLMSPAQERRLARKAKAANLTMGELLRQAEEWYIAPEDLELLDQFAKQVIRATQKTVRGIDKSLALIAQSEARLATMTRSTKKKRTVYFDNSDQLLLKNLKKLNLVLRETLPVPSAHHR
ncbi:hypothetical protein [Nitrospira sp. Nam74]